MDINICSACTFRHGVKDIDKLSKCCYQTCSQFDLDCKAHCDNCIKKYCKACESNPEENFSENLQYKQCSVSEKDKKDILKCCLENCGNDFDCQENCIDSYNSTIPIMENFLVSSEWIPVGSRPLLFFIFTILIHLLLIMKVLQLPDDKLTSSAIIVFIYSSLYIVFFK